MCANPTYNFRTHYQKHTYFFIWPKYEDFIFISDTLKMEAT